MSKYTNPAPLGELFMDATREVIEKGRIKSQMIRLQRIMEAAYKSNDEGKTIQL